MAGSEGLPAIEIPVLLRSEGVDFAPPMGEFLPGDLFVDLSRNIIQ